MSVAFYQNQLHGIQHYERETKEQFLKARAAQESATKIRSS
jgi:hypothetical protein